MINPHKGAIAWMAANPVASNLAMIILIVGGIFLGKGVKQEVMPEFQLDLIAITVPYPGASPAEVEQSILLAVEEEARGLDGVKQVTSTATEGVASVMVELVEGTDGNKILLDAKNAIDRITSFPQDAERPIVRLIQNRREVISLMVYGDFEEGILRGLGEQVREKILDSSKITTVSLQGVRPYEISIEISQENLRTYDLTLDKVSSLLRRSALDVPAGGVKTRGGEILLRTTERRNFGPEFTDIPVVTQADGTQVLLGEIATVIDGFRDTDEAAYFNGKPAITVRVFRVGKQKPIEIAGEVKRIAAELEATLPQDVGIATWYDASEMYAQRRDLLKRNAGMGLILVLVVLGLFLEIRLAFWVTLGIPISVLGAFLLIPSLDVSINMISLFAFIITLGIVVDDAVVVGENIFEMREKGFSRLEAAIRGAQSVAIPVTFSVLTNVVAFAPMLFVSGLTGKFFRVIPIITITVFLISLFESLFILPAHLAHQKAGPTTGPRAWLRRIQRRFTAGLDAFIHGIYRPALLILIKFRYLTVACGVALLMLTAGLVGSGIVKFTFLPKIDQDLVTANATLTFGSPIEDVEAVIKQLEATALEVVAENGGDKTLRGIMAITGAGISGSMASGPAATGSNLAGVSVYLVASDDRPLSASEFTAKWREKLSDIVGLESLTFDYSTGPGGGPALTFELIHRDINVLETAATELSEELQAYTGVKDIDNGFSLGKSQLDFKIRDEARALGVTAADMASQLRSSFYGARAFRQQRGREEVWVMVRLPEDERQSEASIDKLLIRTPGGGEIPLGEAALINRGRSYTKINRTDGKRQVTVTADISVGEANANEVLDDVVANVLPQIMARHPGLQFSLEGEQRRQKESLESLKGGTVVAMIVIFALLAIPLRSYIQPAVVMAAIPFGFFGAVVGHLIMGYNLSMISLMGLVALSGVVVNDSLVMVFTANENRNRDEAPERAIIGACMRRFRPILLTSLTTFFGLAPMMFETSMQARFLIPMAISLGFGILFATFIILFIVPSLYLIVDDLTLVFQKKESGVPMAD